MIRKFQTDHELVSFLCDYTIQLEDAYRIIDRFDSPVPPAFGGATVRQIEKALSIHLHELGIKMFLSEASYLHDEHKWELTIEGEPNNEQPDV